MARYWVTANTAEGFNYRHRGYAALETGDPAKDYPRGFGWPWPKAGIEIEVLDQDEDPKHQPTGEGAVRTVGRRTLAAIRADSHLFVGPLDGKSGGKDGELAAALAKVAELERQIAEAKASAAGGGEAGSPAPAKDKGGSKK